MVSSTVTESSVSHAVDGQGVFRARNVSSFPRGDAEGVGGGGSRGKASCGAVWGRYAGLPAWRWMQMLKVLTVAYCTFYVMLLIGILVTAVVCVLLWWNNSVVEFVGTDFRVSVYGADRVPEVMRFVISTMVSLCSLVGPERVSVWIPYVFGITIAYRLRERGGASDVVVSRLTAVVSTFFSVMFIVIAWLQVVSLDGLSCFLVPMVFVIIAVLFIFPVLLVGKFNDNGKFEICVRLVIANFCAMFNGPLAVVVLLFLPSCLFSSSLPRGKKNGQRGYWSSVYAATGLDSSRIEMVLPAEAFAVVGTGSSGGGESSHVRMLAMVGDRAMSLALSRLALRESWTVEQYSEMSQLVLTNAAFQQFYMANLIGVLPQLKNRSEKRVGTCVEALIGAYYETSSDLGEVEKFVMGRVYPLVK